MIEGSHLLFLTLYNMKKVIKKSQINKITNEISGSEKLKMLEMTNVQQNNEIDVRNDAISERSEIGGYAFAEDDNRMALVT